MGTEEVAAGTSSTVLTLAVAQMRLDRRLEDSLAQVVTMLEQANHEGVDLLVFPECALTGYDLAYLGGLSRSELEQAIDAVKEATRRAGCLTVLGTPTFDLEGRRNSALVITREGRAGALYHKVQLVGEEPGVFVPGNRIGYFEEGRFAGGLLVCHDARYCELTRLPVMMGARLLCHASAGVDSVTSLAWKGLAQARSAHSVQTDTFYLYANAVGGSRDGRRYVRGRSAILHPTGLTLIRADEREEVLLSTHVDLKDAQARWPLKSLEHPAFLREHWERMLEAARRSLRPGQLRMTRADLARLPRPRAAEGYRLRSYRPGDEADWARLIRTYIGGEWDAQSTRANLTGQERFFPDGLFFVESARGEVVGTACAWRPSAEEWEEGELHMVAVDEKHRGHGLGRTLCLAVLRYFREKGFKRVRLSTDDFRLAAIKTYLDLGFAPVPLDELHRQRWQDIQAKLAAPRAELDQGAVGRRRRPSRCGRPPARCGRGAEKAPRG